MVAFNLGSVTVPAAQAAPLSPPPPILTALLSRAVFHERLTLVQWIAMAVAFCGMVNLTLPADGMRFSVGLLWILLSVLSMSAYNLVQRKLTERYSALQSSAYSIAAGSLMLGVFAPGAAGELARAPRQSVALVLALGVLCGAAAYVLWASALSRAPRTSAASNYMFLIPPCRPVRIYRRRGSGRGCTPWPAAASFSPDCSCFTWAENRVPAVFMADHTPAFRPKPNWRIVSTSYLDVMHKCIKIRYCKF